MLNSYTLTLLRFFFKKQRNFLFTNGEMLCIIQPVIKNHAEGQNENHGQKLCGNTAGPAAGPESEPAYGGGRSGDQPALLSHYEKGTREPGLSFVCRVCDYYGVTADYLLGRASHPGDVSLSQSRAFLARLRGELDSAEQLLNSIEGERTKL